MMSMGDENGTNKKGKEKQKIVDNIGRTVGKAQGIYPPVQARSAKEISARPGTGTTASTGAESTGGHFLCSAHRLPVESGSPGIREWEHDSPQISRMAKGWLF